MKEGGTGRLRVYSALGLMGFTTILAQIVFLRKGIANFSGNELGIAVGLFAWLLWVGLGGLLSRGLFPGSRRPEKLLYLALLLLLFLFPLTVILLDGIRSLMGIPVGQVVGLGFISISYLLILAPFCLVDGADFTFGASAAGEGRAPAAFAAESIGAAVGGVFFFAVGVHYLPGFKLAWFLAMVVSLAMVWIARECTAARISSILISVLCLSFIVAPVDLTPLETLRWGRFNIVRAAESPLGSLAWTTGSPGEHVLFYDGSPLLTVPEDRSVEQAVHPPLFVHPDPARVLLVTARVTGVLKQVLAHPVERVDLVVMDRAVLDMERDLIPETGMSLADGRVRAFTGDVRRRLAGMEDGAYDVVILDMPDPGTLQVNRFYSSEFFGQAARTLAPGGIFALSIGEPANYITPAQGRYLASVDRALEPFFPHRVWYPLGRYTAIAGAGPVKELTVDLVDRVASQRGLDLKFMRSEFLSADLAPDRMGDVTRALAEAAGTRPNTDLRPEAVRHRLRLWAGRTGYAGLLSLPERRAAWRTFLVGLAAIGLIFLCAGALGGGGRDGAVLLLMGGFCGISAESVLLYLYQVSYGYLYSRIALMLALYMAGMALGAVLSPWRDRAVVPAWLWAGFFLVTGAFVLSGAAGVLPEPAGLAVFLLLIAAAGSLTGIAFATGSARLKNAGWHRVGGAAYGLDLVGAAVGVIVCGMVLPLMAGLMAPILFSIFLATCVGIGMVLNRRGR
jgi:spermidine synthase